MRHAATRSRGSFRRPAGLFAAVWLLAITAIASAAGQATVTATAVPASAGPGDAIVLEVTVDVADGFHAQSHTPSEETYIPLVVTPAANPAVEFGPPQYPPGKNETYPGLGTLNVYTGRVVVRVPAKLKADAPAGPLKLAGSVRYQACDDTACFAPQRPKFEATVEVGGATATTKPATAPPATQSAGAAATQASASDTAPDDSDTADGRAFGFRLAHDAYVLAFAAAFVVGIFFNAVPCVLPVVPLKIVGFYEAAGHDRRKCFLLGLAFSAGLVASFGVLAVLVVGLKTLTWGGLFTNTYFTIGIVAVLLVMAASQFGLFTFNLPTAAYGFEVRHDTYLGNALFGVLTAALSTPCTIGPFSALLVWALKQPPALGAALVVIVGCGMAFPYFVLSAFPQVMRRFPRTGPVGEIIKQTLAFFVLATAVYFARPLLGGRVSPPAFWWTLFAVIAAAGVFLLVRTIRSVGTRRAVIISGVAAVLIVGGALATTLRLARDPYDWQPYSEAAVADAAKADRPALVDFTADWCGNCHYVEAFVLNSPEIVRAVRDGRIVMLKADVTHGDEPAVPLKNKLAAGGEIPLLAVYRPGLPNPAVLKGVYSAKSLLDILNPSPSVGG